MSSQTPTESALVCPSCKLRHTQEGTRLPRLYPHVLTNGLSCQLCEECRGMLVDIGVYSAWVARQKPGDMVAHHAATGDAGHSGWQALPEIVGDPARVHSWESLSLNSPLPMPLAPAPSQAAPRALAAAGNADADLGEWADTGLATLEAPDAAEPREPWTKPAETGAPGASGRRATLPGDSQHALVCPSCQRLMLRYRVAEPAMGLDFCFACTLVWLDHGEWELLARHGLQLKITQISTSYWQRSQQRQRLQAQREANLRELLGDAAFEQAMAFQRWLAQQPEREAILRFLRSDPPLDT